MTGTGRLGSRNRLVSGSFSLRAWNVSRGRWTRESDQGFGDLRDGGPITRRMTEHHVDQFAQLPGHFHGPTSAVGHCLLLHRSRSVVRVLDRPPTRGGDEQGRAECVDVGWQVRCQWLRLSSQAPVGFRGFQLCREWLHPRPVRGRPGNMSGI